MRTLLLAGATAFLLTGAAPAFAAKTCTAPGHPTCTITCKEGESCSAGYLEPKGPCLTRCNAAPKPKPIKPPKLKPIGGKGGKGGDKPPPKPKG